MLIGEYEDAITVLEQATKIHQRAELYYQLSNSYLHLNDEGKRTKSIAKSLRIRRKSFERHARKIPLLLRSKFLKKRVKINSKSREISRDFFYFWLMAKEETKEPKFWGRKSRSADKHSRNISRSFFNFIVFGSKKNI